jgi:hypothetical protein
LHDLVQNLWALSAATYSLTLFFTDYELAEFRSRSLLVPK